MTDRLHGNIDPRLASLGTLFRERGAVLYAVGGMVRNPLLGLPVSDTDVTSALLPQEVISLCEAAGISYYPKGLDFGTVELHLKDGRGNALGVEHTTFRRDTYAGGGAHRPMKVIFGQSAMEDAFRRDFTVNALYYDILEDRLLDPTGGLEDLKARVIRATSPDPGIILRDDALRILRMARFAAELGFSIDENTLCAAREYAPGLGDISGERVREELNKILLSDVRYPVESVNKGPYYGLSILNRCGALDVLFPELARGRGLLQRRDYHRYDVLEHCLHSVPEIEPVLELRLAALFHDVGKPAAFYHHGNMRGHDELGAGIAREILTRLKYPNAVTARVEKLIRHHMYDLNGDAKDSTIRTWLAGLGRRDAEDVIKLRVADVHGSGRNLGEVKEAVKWRRILDGMLASGAPFSPAELNCTGKDIMAWLSLPPGKAVGEVKEKLFLHCARHPADNTPEKLEKLARDMN